MPYRSLTQCSFFDPEFVEPNCLKAGSVPWLLARHRSHLFPAWLFAGWRGEGVRGRKAWPAVVLATLWLLRWVEEGMSRVASVRRASTDAEWRAALGLCFGVSPPSERTLRDFERFLSSRHPASGTPRYLVLHEHVVRLCLSEGGATDEALWAMDSTPMWCYGAVKDTVRLLGDGLRTLGCRWARATRTSLLEVAKAWSLPLLLAKSTKGALPVDWHRAEERARAVDGLAREVVRVVGLVQRDVSTARPSLQKGLLRLCRNLLRVVRDDLETDEQGRLVVARRVARDRLVSLLDPQARHGRKSRSRRFNGFKLHVLGDVVSGLLAAVTVTAGNEHDGTPAPRLVRRAQALCESIERVLADTAYGGTHLRHRVRETLGVELLAPPPPEPRAKGERFGKSDFAIDFAKGAVTCPAGVTTRDYDEYMHAGSGQLARRYKWPVKVCRACPQRAACMGKTKGRQRLSLHPLEEELREHREAWSDAEMRTAYRRRSECERLVNEPIRHGARRARAWGLGAANRQAHGIVTVCNLRLLARILAARESDEELVVEAV